MHDCRTQIAMTNKWESDWIYPTIHCQTDARSSNILYQELKSVVHHISG